MNGYFTNFLIYTFAMTGIMLLAVIVYKKTTFIKNFGNKKRTMEIEESLNLSPKKTLHIVKVNGEKFLIASDTERTSFLAKLKNDTLISDQKSDISDEDKSFTFTQQVQKAPEYVNIIPGINPDEIKQSANLNKVAQNKKTFSQTLVEEENNQKPVMKNLASKIALLRG